MSSSKNPLGGDSHLQGAARGLPQAGLIAITWSGWLLATVFVFLRCYVRLTDMRKLHVDDYWILAAFAFLTTNAILQTVQTPHSYYVTKASAGLVPMSEKLIHTALTYAKFEFAIISIFWTITWSVKFSFLAMYWRLFDGLSNYRRAWVGVVVFSVLSYIGCWFASAWTCHPPSGYFKWGGCSKPIDIKGQTISISYSTAVDILTDLMIMALPMGLLPGLQINRRQKIGLAGIFGVGFIVIAAALIRLSQIVGQDRTDAIGLAVWGIVESSVSVVVGSLPALKSFLGRAINRTLRRGSSPIPGMQTYPSGHHAGNKMYHDGAGSHRSWTRTDAIPLGDRENSVSNSDSTKSVGGEIVVERSWA